MKFLLSLTLPFFALDQLTKWLVIQRIALHETHDVIPGFFYLIHATNTGAAFSSFTGNNLFFVGLSVVASIVVLYLILGRHQRDVWRDVALSLLLAGIFGNLTDRLVHGHVIDFLLFYLHIGFANPWPAFNVADSCICVAAIAFIVHSFRQKSPPLAPSES